MLKFVQTKLKQIFTPLIRPPWKALQLNHGEDRNTKLRDVKLKKSETLFQNSKSYQLCLNYVRGLGFEEQPNYRMMIGYVLGERDISDLKLDWESNALEDKVHGINNSKGLPAKKKKKFKSLFSIFKRK